MRHYLPIIELVKSIKGYVMFQDTLERSSGRRKYHMSYAALHGDKSSNHKAILL